MNKKRKVYISADQKEVFFTNVEITSPDLDTWDIGQISIISVPEATKPNEWWASITKLFNQPIAQICGNIVIVREDDGDIPTDLKILKREIINFLVVHAVYKSKVPYEFSWK
jgi:hypothetical protein